MDGVFLALLLAVSTLLALILAGLGWIHDRGDARAAPRADALTRRVQDRRGHR